MHVDAVVSERIAVAFITIARLCDARRRASAAAADKREVRGDGAATHRALVQPHKALVAHATVTARHKHNVLYIGQTHLALGVLRVRNPVDVHRVDA
jgi:hypothetical protein